MARRASRETALKVLYAWDLSGLDPLERLSYMTSEKEFDVPAPDDFCGKLVRGVLGCRDMLDGAIGDCALEWDFDRISAVDRNILRIAAFEMLFLKEAPFAAVINEAIEIAKAYGAEDSFRFVNGILDQIKLKAAEVVHDAGN
jgi:N utilization substance protein B